VIYADADSIAQKQKTLDMQMFSYFKNIRNICTPDQVQNFDSTLKKEVTRMVGRPGKDQQQRK
jgi:periplasmic protein CpxP/Spy